MQIVKAHIRDLLVSGSIAQSVALPHNFAEIGYEIISTVILPPLLLLSVIRESIAQVSYWGKYLPSSLFHHSD